MWKGDRQDEIKGGPGRRGYNPTRIGLHLQGFTLVVHEMDYSVGKFHGELGRVLHYHDALPIACMQSAYGICIWLDSEWSKVCFTLILMAWDLAIKGFLHVRTVMRFRITQWYIWDPGIIGGYSGDQ